jgi:HEAT repeat protein
VETAAGGNPEPAAVSLLPGIGVITLDTDLRIRSWNGWLAQATGLPESAVRGRPVTGIVPPPSAEFIQAELAEILKTGSARVLAPALHRCFVRCAPAEANPYFTDMQQRVTIAPLRDDTRIVGAIVTIEDVTGRMVAERERARPRDGESRNSPDAAILSGAADWPQRAAAARALTERATEDDVAQLLEALQRDHDNFSVLSGALQVLVGLRRDITEPLLGLLTQPSANLRMHAALALGALGDRRGVAGLLRALDDVDANVRFHAIEALGRLAAPEAVEGLRRAAGSGDFFLAFPAIDALARIDDPGVAPALVELVGDDHLQPAVIDALAALGDEDCVGALVRLINEGRADVAMVAVALDRIARRYDATFGAAGFIVDAVRAAISDDGVRRLSAATATNAPSLRSVIVVLGWIGEAALPALASLVGKSEADQPVTEALVAIGSPAVPALIARLRDGSRDARVAASSLLGAIGDAQAAPALLEALGSHDDGLLAAAARALAALGSVPATDGLFALFANPDPMVRQAAVAAVNSFGGPATEARVRARLDDPDPLVRECAVRAAGYCAYASCAGGVLRALADDSEDVRRAAIEQLPLLDESRARAALVAALAAETPRNRAAAAHALRMVDDPAVDAPLLDSLSDEDAWVRYFAAGTLAQRGTAAAVPTLEAMAMADAAPHVRIAALTALGVLDAGALRRILEVAVADPDDEIAAAALRALPATTDPEIEALLDRIMFAGSGPVRLAAAEVLGRVATPAAVHSLAWAARLSDPASLADAALTGLAAAAASSDAECRVAAVSALVELGQDDDRRERVIQVLSGLPALAVPAVALALTSSRVSTRALAVEALARMRSAAATAHVTAALDDPDPVVRGAAVLAFGRLGSPGVAPRLLSMCEVDADAGVRRRATAVCRRYGWIAGASRTAETR